MTTTVPADLARKGWRIDRDLWWVRPARADETTDRSFPDGTMGFVDRGRTYTRNADLARRLDRGEPVTIHSLES